MPTLVLNHPIETAFFLAALAATGVTYWVLPLKIEDWQRVRRDGLNGPMQFMVLDNIRRQAFMLAMAVALLVLSITCLNLVQHEDERTITVKDTILVAVLTFMSLGVALDSVFTLRRRVRMAELVAQYQTLPGGKRKHDPKGIL